MKQTKRASHHKLKWGVAGCGRFSEFSFIPTLHLLRKSVLLSLFSHNSARVKSIGEKFGIPNRYTDYDEFLKSDIEAVYIGSANSDHYEQVIKAAEAGKHVLCEKPLSINTAQAVEMVKACEQNNVRFAVNYPLRFHPLISKAKELIESQMIGKLVSINLNYNIDMPPGDNFRFQKKLSGGGAFRDLGTHMLDLLRYFGGEIKDIDGVVDDIIYKSEVEDFAAGIVKFEKSGYGYFNVSYNNKKSFNRIEILGHKGAMSIEKLIGTKFIPSKLTILLDGEAKKAFRKRGNRLLSLLKSVQTSFHQNEPPPVSGYDGYVNMKLMEQLEEKYRSKNIL